jgi:hypothetical protein
MGCYVSVYLPPTREGGNWDPLEGPGSEVKWSGPAGEILRDAGLVPPTDGMFEWEGTDAEAALITIHLEKEHRVFESKLEEQMDEDWSTLYQVSQKLEQWISLFRDLLRLRARGLNCHLFGA